MKFIDPNEKTTLRTLILGIVFIVFFVIIVLRYYNMVYEEKRSNIIKDGRMAAKSSADQFDRYLSTNIDLINFTAYTLDGMIKDGKTDAEIQDFLVGQSTAVKKAVFEESTGLYGYINGRFFSGTNWEPPEGYDSTVRPWYIKPMEHPGELTILEPYLDMQSGNTMLALGKTLCDGVSVVSVDVSLGHMQKLTEEAVKNGGSDIEMILTEDGTVVTHSDRNEVGRTYSEETGTLGATIYGMLDDAHDYYFEFEFEGKKYIVYNAQFEGDWHCISVHDTTSVFAPLEKIFVKTILFLIAIVLIIGIMLAVSNRRAIKAKQAVAANEAKTEFLSAMSHEIRTPINAVLGMNEMILRECKDREILGYSEKIKTAGGELLKLVNELLDFSKNESEEPDINEKHGFIAPSALVLAVDDNPMNLEVLKSLIKRTCINIDTAPGGDEGLDLTQKKKYDMIFLDHMMPEKDGIETLHELRLQSGNPNIKTPVICLTANVIKGARDKYISEGFDDYLTKPVDSDMLEEMLYKYLPQDKIEKFEDIDREISDENKDMLPDELKIIDGWEQMDIAGGIKNCGSVKAYMPLLKIFYTSMDDRKDEINRYLDDGDIKNYTIKVHALKSSARIIGAGSLGDKAQALEDAGKSNDMDYINTHHKAFMDEYVSFREPLSRIFKEEEDNSDKPEADSELMKNVFEELKLAADEMDCDKLQGIFKEMEEYRIPDMESRLWKNLKEASDNYDYDAVLQLIDSNVNV